MASLISTKTKVLKLNCFYGFGLCALLSSTYVTRLLVNMFLSQPNTLGSHGKLWKDWHTLSCSFVGIVNYFTFKELTKSDDNKKNIKLVNNILKSDAFIYGAWFIQNLYLQISTDKCEPLMAIHTGLCGFCAFASLYASML